MPYVILFHPPILLLVDPEQVSAVLVTRLCGRNQHSSLKTPRSKLLLSCLLSSSSLLCGSSDSRSIENLFLYNFWKSQLIGVQKDIENLVYRVILFYNSRWENFWRATFGSLESDLRKLMLSSYLKDNTFRENLYE